MSAYEGDTERARRLVEREKLRFTIAHDPAGEIQQRYRVVGVPTTFVVGADGRLLWQHTGNIRGAFGEARAAVRRVAGGANGPTGE